MGTRPVTVSGPMIATVVVIVAVGAAGHGQSSAEQYNHKSDHAFFKDFLHASVSLKLSIVDIPFCHEAGFIRPYSWQK